MKQKKKRTVIISLAVCLFLVGCIAACNILWRQLFLSDEDRTIVKSAVDRRELQGTYIICKRAAATDGEWRICQTTAAGKLGTYCWVDLSACPTSPSYDLTSLWHNTFVFYLDSLDAKTDPYGSLHYTASGWDVLFPVRHEPFFIFPSAPYGVFSSECAQRRAETDKSELQFEDAGK